MRTSPGFRVLMAAGLLALSCGALRAQQPIGDVLAADSTIRGSVVLASGAPKLTSGSSVTAGTSAAVVRLERGGQVRICPGSTVTLASAGGVSSLLMSLGGGALETHYAIPALADAIMTPDFRLLLAGPGEFDVAVSSNSRGDLCVESRSDSASVLVNELLGDGVYQVRARDTILFHGGRVAGAEAHQGGCGCPAPEPAALRAQVTPVPPAVFTAPLPFLPALPAPSLILPMPSTFGVMALSEMPQLPAAFPLIMPAPVASVAAPLAEIPQPPSESSLVMPAPAAPVAAPLPEIPQLPAESSLAVPAPVAAPSAEIPQPPAEASMTAPPPPLQPNEVHVEVEAPFVFNAVAPPPPATPVQIALRSTAFPVFPLPEVQPPVAIRTPAPPAPAVQTDSKPQKKKGLFGKVRSFFASLFKRS